MVWFRVLVRVFGSGFWSGFSGQVLGQVLGRFRSGFWWLVWLVSCGLVSCGLVSGASTRYFFSLINLLKLYINVNKLVIVKTTLLTYRSVSIFEKVSLCHGFACGASP